LRWNCLLAALFFMIWIAMMPFIIFPNLGPITQGNAFALSIASFPLFAFYASRYDEKVIIPLNYLPDVYSHARRSLEFDGTVLFIGRLFVLGFMALLMCAAILLGFLNAGDVANDIAIYAYYSLVLGVALIALSSWRRRDILLDGKKVERSSLDLGLSSSYHFLETRLNSFKAMLSYHMSLAAKQPKSFHVASSHTAESVPVEKDTMSEILAMRHELLSSIEELRNRLDAMQHISDEQLKEIRKRLVRIEEKLGHQTD